MNIDGRSTSEQLYIPTLLVVSVSEALLARCRLAANTYGLALRVCFLEHAEETVVRRRPLAIVVPNDALEGVPHDLEAIARDVRSVLLQVDPEVSVRELEAMIAGAVAGGLSQRERRGGAGRYSVVDGIEEEAPFSRRSAPPAEPRASVPPASVSPRATMPPVSVRPQSTPLGAMRPQTAPPASMRPQTAPPASMRPQTAPPASMRPQTAPPSTMRPQTMPPASVSPQTAPPSSMRPQTMPPAVAGQRVTLPSIAPAAPGLAKVRPEQAPAESADAPPPSGQQTRSSGMFAAIRAVFGSK